MSKNQVQRKENENLKEHLLDIVRNEFPEGTMWRDTYANAIVEKILQNFELRIKK